MTNFVGENVPDCWAGPPDTSATKKNGRTSKAKALYYYAYPFWPGFGTRRKITLATRSSVIRYRKIGCLSFFFFIGTPQAIFRCGRAGGSSWTTKRKTPYAPTPPPAAPPEPRPPARAEKRLFRSRRLPRGSRRLEEGGYLLASRLPWVLVAEVVMAAAAVVGQ